MSTEYKYQPFIVEFGETKQKGIVRRPYLDKIGYGKEWQVFARLHTDEIRVVRVRGKK